MAPVDRFVYCLTGVLITNSRNRPGAPMRIANYKTPGGIDSSGGQLGDFEGVAQVTGAFSQRVRSVGRVY
jgi:hypothetical protein